MTVIEFRVRPALRKTCACRHDDSQFVWSLFKRVPDAEAETAVKVLNRERYRKLQGKKQVRVKLFDYRVKPRMDTN